MSHRDPKARQPLPPRPYRPSLPSAPSPPSPSAAKAPTRLPKSYYVVGGLFVYGITGYSYSYFSAIKEKPSDHGLPSQDADVSPTYDNIAHDFDSCVGLSEFLGGINRQRKKLARQATGHVLEVSAGTGRNSKYYNLDYTWKDWSANTHYAELQRRKTEQDARRKTQALPEIDIDVPPVSPWVEARSKAPSPTRAELLKKSKQVSSLTFVDLSAPMVDIARKVFQSKYPGYGPVQFLTQSALDPLPPTPITNAVRRQGGYDYILQSMGLCSTPEPVQLLKHLAELAHPGRGKILLLEHGRGYWGWMNRYLDATAPRHAKVHGCWYNRDIGKIVEESGLVVESCKRKHFGTLWVVEARPRRNTDAPQRPSREEKEKKLTVTTKPTVLAKSSREEVDDKRKEPNAPGPGFTARAWSSIRSLTGMNGMKEEDPELNEKQEKKDD